MNEMPSIYQLRVNNVYLLSNTCIVRGFYLKELGLKVNL